MNNYIVTLLLNRDLRNNKSIRGFLNETVVDEEKFLLEHKNALLTETKTWLRVGYVYKKIELLNDFLKTKLVSEDKQRRIEIADLLIETANKLKQIED